MDEKSHDRRWRNRLLPLMTGMLLGMTLFFFIASLVQLYYLHNRIAQSPQLDLSRIVTKDVNNESSLRIAHFKALVLLEGNAVERRYHQANVLLMSRVWTRYLGFVTGMILTLVGAAFILGKLREPESKLNAESSLWKISFISTSPGLVLALFGTLLMLTTIVTHSEIEVNDGPLYLGGMVMTQEGKTELLEFPDEAENGDIDAMLQDAAKQLDTLEQE